VLASARPQQSTVQLVPQFSPVHSAGGWHDQMTGCFFWARVLVACQWNRSGSYAVVSREEGLADLIIVILLCARAKYFYHICDYSGERRAGSVWDYSRGDQQKSASDVSGTRSLHWGLNSWPVVGFVQLDWWSAGIVAVIAVLICCPRRLESWFPMPWIDCQMAKLPTRSPPSWPAS